MVGASLQLSEEVRLLKKFNPPQLFSRQSSYLHPHVGAVPLPRIVQHSHPSGHPQAWVPGSGKAHVCRGRGNGTKWSQQGDAL